MAQIVSETVTITFSKLVKNNEKSEQLLSSDLLTALETVAAELCEDSTVVVEVEKIQS